MKDAKLWDFNEREYSDVQIPDGCKTFAIDMDEEVICPDCLETLKYGDGYISLRWHDSAGIGYTVCEKCYEMEKKLGRLANYRNKSEEEAEWLDDGPDYKCSKCGTRFSDEIVFIQWECELPKHCPACGIRMKQKEETT